MVLHRDRRCRNNMDLLRSVMMSLLTVLGHSLLRCLCVGFELRALVEKMFVAMLRPSVSRSCMASAALITSWRVLSSILGSGAIEDVSNILSVEWRVLRCCWMEGIWELVVVSISFVHCVRSGCGR